MNTDTALIMAAFIDNLEIVKLLLNYNTDVNKQNNDLL